MLPVDDQHDGSEQSHACNEIRPVQRVHERLVNRLVQIFLGYTYHRKQALEGSDCGGYLVEYVSAIKAAVCGNGSYKQIVHMFLL